MRCETLGPNPMEHRALRGAAVWTLEFGCGSGRISRISVSPTTGGFRWGCDGDAMGSPGYRAAGSCRYWWRGAPADSGTTRSDPRSRGKRWVRVTPQSGIAGVSGRYLGELCFRLPQKRPISTHCISRRQKSRAIFHLRLCFLVFFFFFFWISAHRSACCIFQDRQFLKRRSRVRIASVPQNQHLPRIWSPVHLGYSAARTSPGLQLVHSVVFLYSSEPGAGCGLGRCGQVSVVSSVLGPRFHPSTM